jgi:hypothetical protein
MAGLIAQVDAARRMLMFGCVLLLSAAVYSLAAQHPQLAGQSAGHMAGLSA